MGKDAQRRQRGAGAPWPGMRPPAKTPDETLEEGTHVPQGFPFPFPFEEVTVSSTEADDLLPTVGPWEDKSWGSLGESLEGQSHEEAKQDEFYSRYFADDFADDFDDTALESDDIAEFMISTESAAFEWPGFTSKSAVVQGVIMSEVLKRPRAFSRYPIIR